MVNPLNIINSLSVFPLDFLQLFGLFYGLLPQDLYSPSPLDRAGDVLKSEHQPLGWSVSHDHVVFEHNMYCKAQPKNTTKLAVKW